MASTARGPAPAVAAPVCGCGGGGVLVGGCTTLSFEGCQQRRGQENTSATSVLGGPCR